MPSLIRRTVLGRSLMISSLALGACGDDTEAPHTHTVTVAVKGLPNGAADGDQTLSGLTLEAVDDEGAPVTNLLVELKVTAGGGSVTPTRVRTDATGKATLEWALGALPVPNVLLADAGSKGTFETTIDVATAGAITPSGFGDIDVFLTSKGIEGSTEDLAFAPDGKLVMGVPGALVALGPDGGGTLIATTGETLKRPLGLAYDQDGRLWIADGDADALMRLDADGKVTKVADHDGVEAFIAPNDVAVAEDGRVFMSDTCTGKVYAFAADGTVAGRIAFDAQTEGGPNGLVVGPDGALWITTENTGLFCAHDDIDITASVAGLYRVPVLGDGSFGPREDMAEGVAVFGDGLAFDAAGNLYVIFDTIEGLALDESIVFALPKGQTMLRRAFATTGQVWANLAFGQGEHGTTTLYLSLLATPPFTPASARGAERVKLDIEGAVLPPMPPEADTTP